MAKSACPMVQIATAACLATPLKINKSVMVSFCKFTCALAAEGMLPLVDEFLQFWSACVDPQQIAIPHTYFDTMAKVKALEKQPLLRMHMTMAMYCEEGVSPRPHWPLVSKRHGAAGET